MTNFRGILGQSWNSEISAILPYEILEFNWLKIPLKLVIFQFMKKSWDLKRVFSNLEPEEQGHGIIMGVTRLLLLGLFYTIQTNFMYFFAHDCTYFFTCIIFRWRIWKAYFDIPVYLKWCHLILQANFILTFFWHINFASFNDSYFNWYLPNYSNQNWYLNEVNWIKADC